MKKFIFYPLIISLIFVCGCYSLRKKFIRKKKIKKEIPVYVDFKEYSKKPSREVYVEYYLFVRGWLDEAIEGLRRGGNFKRAKKSFDEAVMNLEQIISFYNREGKEKIFPLYEELLEIKEEIYKSPNMSQNQKNLIILKLERIKRTLEKNFNYSQAKKWMD
jgi:predicted RND superfamily exporter protein